MSNSDKNAKIREKRRQTLIRRKTQETDILSSLKVEVPASATALDPNSTPGVAPCLWVGRLRR